MATVALAVVSSFLAMLATLAVLVATSILDSAAGSPGWMWARYLVPGFGNPSTSRSTLTPPSTSSKGAVPLTPELSIVTSGTSANATSRSRDTYRTLS